ncbi:hypothetical protein CCH79_00010802, partial [Gambusia affinis]
PSSDKEAKRCCLYQKLVYCFGSLCVILVVAIIGRDKPELKQLKDKQIFLLDEIYNMTNLNNKFNIQVQNLTAEISQVQKNNHDLETKMKTLGEEIKTCKKQKPNQALHIIDEYCPKENGSGMFRFPYVRLCRSCPKGWIHSQSSCYAVNNPEPKNQKTWEDAREDCRGKSSNLTVIGNQEEKTFVDDSSWKDNKGKMKGFWIGLSVEGRKWKWIDGNDLTNQAWIPQPATDGQCVTSLQEREWKSVNCSERNGWICEKKALSWSIDEYCPKTNNGRSCTSCQNGWNYNLSSCYAYVDPPNQKTWEGALEECRSKKSDLTVVYDQAEKDYVNTISHDSSGINGYWIGLKAVEGKWKWTDGSDLTNQIWIQQQIAIDGYCVTSLKGRGWNTVICSDKNAWICEKKALSSTSQIEINIKAVNMAEEEVSYVSVVVKTKKKPQSRGKNEEETVYDEVKVNKEAVGDAEVENQNESVQQTLDTKGFLPDKAAERCRRYQQLCCCFGTLCVILVLSVIGICVYCKYTKLKGHEYNF